MGMEELFQTVAKEYVKPIDAKITGRIPEWIEGSLYRNGPSKFEFGDTKYNHWFDGMAMLHRFKISQGKVTYQDRFIESAVYRKNMQANRIICSEFGTMAFPDPCKTIFERMFSYFHPAPTTDNTVVNVFPFGEGLYAATETNLINKIDPATLEATDQVDLSKVVSVNGATAHPHWDEDGSLYNLGTFFPGGPSYTIVKFTPPKPGSDQFCETAEVVAQVTSRWRFHPSYLHSFGITPNYFIIIEQPLVINVLKILTARIRGCPFNTAMEYYPDHPVKFHIIDRRTNEKVNADTDYVADAFFTFHHVNAYEENGQLVVDACLMSDPNVFQCFKVETIQSPGVEEHLAKFAGPQAGRFVLPLNLESAEAGKNLTNLDGTTSTAILTRLDKPTKGVSQRVHVTKDLLYPELAFDFPQINYKKNGVKYRYIYGVGYIQTQLDCITKFDVKTRELKRWYVKGVYPSEPVFVAAPGATEEDDGVLLSMVLTTGPGRSAFLLVLDARTLEEIGRAEADVQISRDMHGMFVPGL